MNDALKLICSSIDAQLAQKEQVIVAIDGNCTAGKTTLADALETLYDCNVIHIDDFFLQPHQRTAERYAETGGNVDYERFAEEVLHPLRSGMAFSYRPFDCRTFALAEPIELSPKKLTIIEGSYSHHPYFKDPYDLKIFLTVTPDLQRRRIQERPTFLHKRFFEEWIPMEHRYFHEFQIMERSDIATATSSC